MKNFSGFASHLERGPAREILPRKTPVQARSRAALESIHEAAIQVLLRDGPSRLTTVRVASRAGVSVGSIYQYYPNKQAILFAVIELHLLQMAERMEEVAGALHRMPLEAMIEGVVRTYVDVKLARPDVSAALYRVHAELNAQEPVAVASERLRAALTAMFESAEEMRGVALKLPVFLLQTSLAGAARTFLEAGLPVSMRQPMTEQLCVMATSYFMSDGLRGR